MYKVLLVTPPDVSTDPVLAFTDILALMEMWMGNDETVPVEGYKCITQFKRQDVRAGEVAIYEKNNATTMATPHFLMILDKQNMAKTSFK
jgi:glutamate synthase domain-containing protein 1